MKILIDELKNNFCVDNYLGQHKNNMIEKITTDWFDTYDKAVDNLVKILKDRGVIKILLPYLPVPYVIDDREGNYQGVLTYLSLQFA